MSRVDRVFDLLVSANPEVDDKVGDDRLTFVDVLERTAREPEPLRRPVRRPLRWRGPLVGFAVAAVVAIVGLAVVLLSSTTPTETPPADTEPTTPPPTAALTPPTVSASGEGPELVWTRVNGLPMVDAEHALWFAGNFYVFGRDSAAAYRSADGFTWEEEPSLATELGEGVDSLTTVVASGDTMVAVATVGLGSEDGGCVGSEPASLRVAVTSDGIAWSIADVPIDLPEVGSAVCVSVHEGPASVSAAGILVSAEVSAEDGYEDIVGSVLGDVWYEDGFSMEVIDHEIHVTMRDNEQHVISLTELGYAPGDFAVEDGFFKTALAWHSNAGAEWQQIVREGPMRSFRLDSIVADPEGFYVSSPSGTFHTADGSAWEPVELAGDIELLGSWNDAVIAGSDDGLIYDLAWQWPLELSEAFTGEVPLDGRFGSGDWPGNIQFAFGPAGAVSHSLDPWGLDGVPRIVVWSEDGSKWRLWTPPEFAGPNFLGIERVAVGDDRVVAITIEDSGGGSAVQVIWVGTPTDRP